MQFEQFLRHEAIQGFSPLNSKLLNFSPVISSLAICQAANSFVIGRAPLGTWGTMNAVVVNFGLIATEKCSSAWDRPEIAVAPVELRYKGSPPNDP